MRASMKLSVTSVVLICLQLASAQEPKIVGGYNVTSMNEFRYQVSIRQASVDRQIFGRGHLCGGSLITLQRVLTAAHCVHSGSAYYSPSLFVVAMGGIYRYVKDNNTLYYNVARIAGHKNYQKYTYANDIALLYLSETVPSNHPTVYPISLATQTPQVGRTCVISGWGTLFYNGTQPEVMNAASVSINSRSQCNQRASYDGSVLTGMFCAGPFSGGIDSCQGDSGGPLVCSGALVGITSNGVECARANYPGVYIDVHYYRNWIQAGDSTTLVGNIVTTIFAAVIASMSRQFL